MANKKETVEEKREYLSSVINSLEADSNYSKEKYLDFLVKRIHEKLDWKKEGQMKYDLQQGKDKMVFFHITHPDEYHTCVNVMAQFGAIKEGVVVYIDQYTAKTSEGKSVLYSTYKSINEIASSGWVTLDKAIMILDCIMDVINQ